MLRSCAGLTPRLWRTVCFSERERSIALQYALSLNGPAVAKPNPGTCGGQGVTVHVWHRHNLGRAGRHEWEYQITAAKEWAGGSGSERVMRRFAKELWAWSLLAARRLWTPLGSEPSAFVLCYHRVSPVPEDEWAEPALVLSPKMFEEHIRHLSQMCHVMSLTDLLQTDCTSMKPAGQPACAITFDDGWQDNYLHAYPVLRRYDCPATIFLTVGLIGTAKLPWTTKLYHMLHLAPSLGDRLLNAAEWASGRTGPPLCPPKADNLMRRAKRVPRCEREALMAKLERALESELRAAVLPRLFLDWAEVVEMANNRVVFGAHSMTHAMMDELTREEALREFADSRRVIEEHLGKPPEIFAYPDGRWDNQLRVLAKETGYRWACALVDGDLPGTGDGFGVKRVPVSQSAFSGIGGRFSPALLAWETTGIGDWVREFRRRDRNGA